MKAGSSFGKSFVDVPSRLGVNTSSKPAEQFEVNGDSKITGSLKVNGEITKFGQSSPLAKIMCDNGTSNTNAGQQRLYMTPTSLIKEADNSLTFFSIKNTCDTKIAFYTGTTASNLERVRLENTGVLKVDYGIVAFNRNSTTSIIRAQSANMNTSNGDGPTPNRRRRALAAPPPPRASRPTPRR